jgi:hypothetical protein
MGSGTFIDELMLSLNVIERESVTGRPMPGVFKIQRAARQSEPPGVPPEGTSGV